MKKYKIERRNITTGKLWWKSTRPMYCIIKSETVKALIPCWTDGGDLKEFENNEVVSMHGTLQEAKSELKLWDI